MSDNSVYDVGMDILKMISESEAIQQFCNENVAFVFGGLNEDTISGQLQEDTTTFHLSMGQETDIGTIAENKELPYNLKITYKGQGPIEVGDITVIDGIQDVERIIFGTKSVIIGSDIGTDLQDFKYMIHADKMPMVIGEINFVIRQPNVLDNN